MFRRLKQPALVGEILVGVILGPTVLGRFFPGIESFLFPQDATQKSMLDTVSWLGVFFLLLVTGFEVDSSVIWRHRRTSISLGLTGMLVPAVLGFAAALIVPERFIGSAGARLPFALLFATIVGISAVPVIAKVLQDFDILKSDFGLNILASSTLKDILAWVLFTLVLGLVFESKFAWLSMLKVVGGTFLFLVVSFTLGRVAVDRLAGWFNKSPLPKPGIILSFIVILGGVCGALSQLIGIHAAFGFLVAGIMAGEASQIQEKTRETITQVVNSFFVPVFFVTIGLRVDFLANFDLLIVLIVLLIDMGGKFLGAILGAKLARMPSEDVVAAGIALIPGGAMEIIISGLALEYGIISLAVFESIVIAAVVSSIVVGPLLSATLKLKGKFDALKYFFADGIIENLNGSTPTEVIAELCEAVSRKENAPEEPVSSAAVNMRESILGTGMEKGIAIPHARIEGIREPVFTLGRSYKGIEWNTSDGLPVNFVFLLLTPQDDKEDFQVKILAAIARTMEAEKVRLAVLKAESRDDISRVLTDALRQERMGTNRFT